MTAAVPLAELVLDQTAEALVYANRDGVIERWNAAAVTMFGDTAAEAIGQRLDLMIPERLPQAHWHGFNLAMDSATLRLGGHPTLTRGLHKSGQKLFIGLSFALVLDATGAALGSVAVARDVTARVKRERAAFGVAGHPRSH